MGVAIKAHEAARIGETLVAENKRLYEENEVLKEKIEKIDSRFNEMLERYNRLREFEPLLEDAPEYLQFWIRDKTVLRQLMARALRIYGPAGAHPDLIPKENEVLKRRARLNFETIIQGCLKYALGPAWGKVYATYIKNIPL